MKADVLYMILETMYRGFGFSHVIFCILNAEQGKMVARFGLGEYVDEIVKNFHFRIRRSADIFNIAIAMVPAHYRRAIIYYLSINDLEGMHWYVLCQ